jgi:hypothetical protein
MIILSSQLLEETMFQRVKLVFAWGIDSVHSTTRFEVIENHFHYIDN